MARHSRLLEAPPFAVERALKTLGANIRTARVRRKLTLEELAQKLGVSRRILSDMEKGKPSTGIGIYVSALWALDLLDHLSPVADPAKDAEGMALALTRERSKARKSEVLDNDF
jgi:transcriptional regulator with XRE-family HTH domain